jgi:hypothetical protein
MLLLDDGVGQSGSWRLAVIVSGFWGRCLADVPPRLVRGCVGAQCGRRSPGNALATLGTALLTDGAHTPGRRSTRPW